MSLDVTTLVASAHLFQQPITRENFGKVDATLQDVLIQIDALTAWADKVRLVTPPSEKGRRRTADRELGGRANVDLVKSRESNFPRPPTPPIHTSPALEVKEKTAVKYLGEALGSTIWQHGHLTPKGFDQLVGLLSKEAKRQNYTLPWESQTADEKQADSVSYSMFPLKDEIDWEFYCIQEGQMWTAKELEYIKDKTEYPTLPTRYQELYCDLLGFFQPGDGLVSFNVLRFIREADSYAEMMFLIAQLFIESVHSEAYGMSVVSILPDKKDQARVFAMVDDQPCVKAKAAFIKKYINSGKSKAHRYIAAACSEGIFFVTLFAIIFYFRNKSVMKTFVFLNEQVAKDETTHRDYYCAKAKKFGLPPREEILEIIEEAVKIEVDHMAYIMRKPIDSPEIDAAAGMTVENLTTYAKTLADQILVLLGATTHYNVKCELPHMNSVSMSNKTNFYEDKVGSYKKYSVSNAINWMKRAGLIEADTDGVADPTSVDF